MLLLLVALLYTTFSALDSRIYFSTREQLALGLVGMVLPMLSTYFIIKGKLISKWLTALQIVTPVILLGYLSAGDSYGFIIPGYIIQLAYLLALGATCYLFFSKQMRAYYRWLGGEESDVNWMTERRLKLAIKMSNSEQTITAVLEVIFILFALAVFGFMLIPHFWK